MYKSAYTQYTYAVSYHISATTTDYKKTYDFRKGSSITLISIYRNFLQYNLITKITYGTRSTKARMHMHRQSHSVHMAVFLC